MPGNPRSLNGRWWPPRPNLSNLYFYDSFEDDTDNWFTGSNPFSITTSESRHGGSSAESGIVNTSNTLSYLRTDDNVWINNIPKSLMV